MANGGGTREVKVGVKGDSYTQITSGLNEGDLIELLQGSISSTGQGQNGQGRTGQFPGGGQLPGGGAGGGTGGGFQGANRGR
jgi:macrolide-specific efflux system membrane fusion protein